jgi:hypothetical protein
MTNSYTWKKRLFDNESTILMNGQPVGHFEMDVWNANGEGWIGEQKIGFITRDWLYRFMMINDPKTGKELGKITLNAMWTKATITLTTGQTYTWRATNLLFSKWRLEGADGTLIQYNSDLATKGSIQSESGTPLLLLTGLYIAGFLNRMSILILIIILVPLFVNRIL